VIAEPEPEPYLWDYTLFGKPGARHAAADETFEITILEHNAELGGFNQWLLNGVAFSMETMEPAYTVEQGRRYRLKFRNASDDIHPLHLHRHSFELVRVGGKPSAGVIKDVVMLAASRSWSSTLLQTTPDPACSTATSNCTWISDSWQCSTTREIAYAGDNGYGRGYLTVRELVAELVATGPRFEARALTVSARQSI